MMADGSAAYAKALGLEMDLTARGMGVRSQRYSMLVEDGVVTALNIEQPGKFEVSDAETMLRQRTGSLKRAHLRRWLARALAAAYRKYASLSPGGAAWHLDLFEQPGESGYFRKAGRVSAARRLWARCCRRTQGSR